MARPRFFQATSIGGGPRFFRQAIACVIMGGRPGLAVAIGGRPPFFLWDSMGYAYYYIQYMLEHKLDPETVTREQVNAASDYALKKCQDDYMRDDRAIGFFGIAICVLLMLFFIFSFICALNGTPMK